MKPNFELTGKTALVTGAGRGLGKAIALALAASGARLTLIARSKIEIEAVAAEITKLGGEADVLAVDVKDLVALRDAVGEKGPFHILVNNAGINLPAQTIDVSEDDFDDIMSVNVKSAFFLAQAVGQSLIAAGEPGSIINISSQMGHVGSSGRSVYCASKHAVEGFTKAMAIEWGSYKIRVNTVCPTFIETPLTRPFLENESFKESVLKKIHLGRIGQVDDVTGAVVFLASEAASLVTGSALRVDGGWTAD